MVINGKKLLSELQPCRVTLTPLVNPTMNELVDYTKRGYSLNTGKPDKDNILTRLLRVS